MRSLIVVALSTCLLLVGLVAPAAGRTVVDCDAGDDLQVAIDGATSGDRIVIQGMCVGNYTAGDPSLRLTLQGRGDRAELSGATSSEHVLEVRGDIHVKNLTISGGFDGIHTLGTRNLTVIDSTIRGASRDGIRNDHGSLTMRRSVVRDNLNDGLSALGYDNCGSTVDISSSTFRGNGGHGIFNRASMTVTHSTITGNDRAGIHNDRPPCAGDALSVARSTITGNSGHGIRNDCVGCGVVATVRGSTISGNVTAGVGGGITNAGTFTLVSSQVTANTASDGGGIHNVGTITIKNSTIADNSPNDCVGC